MKKRRIPDHTEQVTERILETKFDPQRKFTDESLHHLWSKHNCGLGPRSVSEGKLSNCILCGVSKGNELSFCRFCQRQLNKEKHRYENRLD